MSNNPFIRKKNQNKKDSVSAGGYSKLSEEEQLIERAIEILATTAPKTRSPENIRLLKTALQPNLEKMHLGNGEEILIEALQRVRHEELAANQIVFSIGDKGKLFYAIMRGSVGIFVNVPKKYPTAEDSPIANNQQQYEVKEVNTLRAGDNFGELALLNDSTRTATIICKEQTDFFVLDAADFKRVTAVSTKWRVHKNVSFLKELPLFQGVNPRSISTLIYHIKIVTPNLNQILFREGDEASHIYVIKKGEITLQKEVHFQIDVDTSNIITNVMRIKNDIKKIVQDFVNRIKNLKQYGKFFHMYCENKLSLRSMRIENIKAVKDQKKEILYGRPEIYSPFLKSNSNSPQKSHSNTPAQKISPSKQSSRVHRRPIAPTLARQSVFESPLDKQKTFISQVDNLITFPQQPPRRSIRREENSSLSPIKTMPVEINILPPAVKDSRIDSVIDKANAPKSSHRSDRLNKTVVNFALEENNSFRVTGSKRTATLSPDLKTEVLGEKLNTTTMDFGKSSPLLENARRKHITNKTYSLVRDDQKYFIQIDANEKKMKERGIIDLSSMDGYSFFSDADNLTIKNPKQRYKIMREKTQYTAAPKPSLPFREVTIIERIQMFQRAPTPSRLDQQLSQSPMRLDTAEKAKNIHLDKLRGNDMSRIFQAQVKIINSIAKEGSYSQYTNMYNQTNSRLQTPNPNEKQHQFKFDSARNYLSLDNDQVNYREDTQRSSERAMMIKGLTNGK